MTHAEISAFIAVANLKSFLAAARLLNTNQSSVSQRVASLERALSATLFDRSTRSVSLSAEGERFMPYATRLLDAFADAHASTRAAQSATLRGHILPTMDPQPIQRALHQLMQSHPTIALDIQTSTGHEAIQGIQSRLFDFAILPPPDITGVRLRATTLLEIKEEVRPYVASGHALLKRRRLTLEQIGESGVPLVYITLWWKRPRQLRALIKAAAASCEMPAEVGVNWCTAGNGIMFLNAGYARRHIEAGILASLSIIDMPKTYRIMHLIKPRLTLLSEPLREFCAVVAKEAVGEGVEVRAG